MVSYAWENSDVSLSVQDFQRLHFEIVTSAAASIPKEVRAYPERGSGPVSQAHLERGLRLDLITMTLHNYSSWQVHETLNGVNPSSGFRGIRSAKSGSNLWPIWQVFGPWASPYEANGQTTMTVHNYRPRQFHRTSNGEHPSSGYRDMGSASLAAARPDRDDNTPPARRAQG